MSSRDSAYITERIEEADTKSGFSCGKHPLDDYFVRHALANDRRGICRAFVLRGPPGKAGEPAPVLGFYTLSMASAESAHVAAVLKEKLPRYPMPVALVGRLAVDVRVQGRRLGEQLLVEALRRVVDAASMVGCTGIIVDAKDEAAEKFYAKYDFVTVAAETWPRRMSLSIGTAQKAFADDER
jgi:GNAT superfamily N-acetyltransferase